MTRAYGALDPDCVAQSSWDSAVDNAKTLTVFAGQDTPIISNLELSDVTVGVTRRVLPSPASAVCVIQLSITLPFSSMFGEVLVPFTSIGVMTLNASAEAVYIGE